MAITCVDDWPEVGFQLKDRIASMSNARARMDLNKMFYTIEKLITQLSKEEIECRRLHKQTIKHRELLEKINEQISFLDQMILFGALST